MSDIVVHHINISYNESDERVRNFVKYLKNEERKDEMSEYFNKVKNSPDGKIYLKDIDGNEFSLFYNGGYNCALNLRGM
ncbi:MAG: hypothetical protein WCX46_00880 [Candidatus Paceibacterota bacterium]